MFNLSVTSPYEMIVVIRNCLAGESKYFLLMKDCGMPVLAKAIV